MFKCKYFAAHELVPPAIYDKWGERSFMFMDDRLLHIIDTLREEFGAATINNYKFGGDRQWSGLRTSDSPYYSPTSQHSFGRAADVLFRGHSAEKIREFIKNDSWLVLDCATSVTIEEGVNWLHIDVRNNNEGLNYFKP